MSQRNRLSRQIKWGMKVCNLRRKYDYALDLLNKCEGLPADLFITQHSLTRMLDTAKKRQMKLLGSLSITEYL